MTSSPSASNRFVGIYINSIYAEYEGVDEVLDRIATTGARAICTVPKLQRSAPEGGGVRFPDLHWDGHRRHLARPLWGRHSLHLEATSAFDPRRPLYADTSYGPPRSPGSETDLTGSVVHRLLRSAKARGLKTHLAVQPFVHNEVHPADQPVTIDGTPPGPPHIADFACLNSLDAREYGLALVRDTVEHFPDIDGLFLDWAEYGAYRLEDHFACVCAHCERQASIEDLDWIRIRRDLLSVWERLHSITAADVRQWEDTIEPPWASTQLLLHTEGLRDLARLKELTVSSFYRDVRSLLDDLGLGGIRLSARGWPPPWNTTSGADYRALADYCDAVTPKLFTFDYAAIPRWYGETLQAWNPDLDKEQILRLVLPTLGLGDGVTRNDFSEYVIPRPDQEPPLDLPRFYRDRIQNVAVAVGDSAFVHPTAHAYLSDDSFADVLRTAASTDADGLWIQMYGYLSEANVDALRAYALRV